LSATAGKAKNEAVVGGQATTAKTTTAIKSNLPLIGSRASGFASAKPAFVASSQKAPAAALASSSSLAPSSSKGRSKVASVFSMGDDSSSEEEMPHEAKMRMRNVGRDTITSSGPNSFGKTRQGFCDANKLYEKNLKIAMDKAAGE